MLFEPLSHFQLTEEISPSPFLLSHEHCTLTQMCPREDDGLGSDKQSNVLKRAGKQSYRLIVVVVADSFNAVVEKSTTLSFLTHYFYLRTYPYTHSTYAHMHSHRSISHFFIIFHISLNRMRWGGVGMRIAEYANEQKD